MQWNTMLSFPMKCTKRVSSSRITSYNVCYTKLLRIQARTGSTRLHNKILLPFDGEKCILDILIGNIKAVFPEMCIVLATTVRKQDDVLEETACKLGIHCFRGDEDNVLDRFIKAGEAFGLDRMVRVCSDNPFLQPDVITSYSIHYTKLYE